MILVDTNVLLDVLQDDPQWAAWSQAQLESASVADRLAINSVIYAELSISFARIEELDAAIKAASLRIEEIPKAALFLAGKVFPDYRRRQGGKSSVLPDVYIGAHAAVRGWPILTRDGARYRTYFPTVSLLAPDGA